MIDEVRVKGLRLVTIKTESGADAVCINADAYENGRLVSNSLFFSPTADECDSIGNFFGLCAAQMRKEAPK